MHFAHLYAALVVMTGESLFFIPSRLSPTVAHASIPLSLASIVGFTFAVPASQLDKQLGAKLDGGRGPCHTTVRLRNGKTRVCYFDCNDLPPTIC